MSKTIKSIKKEQARFDRTYKDIMNTPYGSLLQSIGILKPEYRKQKYAFVRAFEKVYLPYMDDEKFVKKTLDAFDITYDDVKDLPIIKIESKYNFLFYPYLECEDGNPIVLPLFPDGLYQSTAYHIEKMEPVDWDREFGLGIEYEIKDEENEND